MIMGRYYYPNAIDALDAKKQFLREHHRRANHCFRNDSDGNTGYVLFDTKEDVNQWWEEQTGEYFYKAEYKPGTVFTKFGAIREIEDLYGAEINSLLARRDMSLPVLAIGLCSATAFGNRIFLTFAKSAKEEDICWRFYTHYNTRCWSVSPQISNTRIRQELIDLLYKYFYEDRFRKRIEGSKNFHGNM